MSKPTLPPEKTFYGLDGKKVDGEQPFNDIANAMMKLRAAFLRHGFQPPKAIEMASREDGDRLRHVLPRDMVAAYAVEGRRDDLPDVMFTVMGIEFRYPAAFRARHKGGFDII